jgi:hypothetical protein
MAVSADSDLSSKIAAIVSPRRVRLQQNKKGRHVPTFRLIIPFRESYKNSKGGAFPQPPRA